MTGKWAQSPPAQQGLHWLREYDWQAGGYRFETRLVPVEADLMGCLWYWSNIALAWIEVADERAQLNHWLPYCAGKPTGAINYEQSES